MDKQYIIDELKRYKESDEYRFIVGVQISKAKPWPPAIEMLELHDKGLDVKAIAKKVGYSVKAVEHNLKTKGIDPRVGLQCDKYLERVFSIDEALALMPIPCSEKCICYWRTILKSDVDV